MMLYGRGCAIAKETYTTLTKSYYCVYIILYTLYYILSAVNLHMLYYFVYYASLLCVQTTMARRTETSTYILYV